MALSEKMKLRIHYARRLAALPRDPFARLTVLQRAADMDARATLEDEARSKCVTDLDSAFELIVLEEIARLDPEFAEWFPNQCQDRSDAEFMADAKLHHDYLIGEDKVSDSVPEETPKAPEKERTDTLSAALKGLAKGPGPPSAPNQPDPLEASRQRKIPIFNPRGGVSMAYGTRSGKLLGIATRNFDTDAWTTYIGKNEASLYAGVAQRFEAPNINKVKNIFNREGLVLTFSPDGIKVPDLATLAAGASMNRRGAHVNEKQKTVLIVVAIAVLAMLMFPPFYAKFPGGEVFNVGYGLIVSPPPPFGSREDLVNLVHVNVGLLITQWLGVLIAGGIAFILFKD